MNAVSRQNSTLAVVSLIFGLLGWTFLPLIGSLVAIVTGHMARSEIRAQPDRYEGDGLALVGLVLGYVSIVIAVLLVLGFLLFFGGLAWLAAISQ